MTVHVSSARRQAMMDAGFDVLNSGTIEIRSGAQEANPEATAAGTLLVTCTFGSTAFSAAAGAAGATVTKTANAITSGIAGNTGTAAHCRLVTSSAACVLIGDVAASGSDLNLPTAIGSGATVSITSLVLNTIY